MFLLQQNPIVVEVSRQPTPTPEISYVSVLSTAMLMVFVIVVVALAIGGVVGGIIIWRQRRRAATVDTSAPSHVRLQI